MMKRWLQPALWALLLVLVTTCLGVIHFLIFHDARNFFFYLLMDVAFVPVEVLIATVVIQKLLSVHEKRSMLKKLNMVIGCFFSEVGRSLLQRMAKLDPDLNGLAKELHVGPDWHETMFIQTSRGLRKRAYKLQGDAEALLWLKAFLGERRGFLLALLENPNLLEHDAFTDLLWAVFHLMEELEFREDLTRLPEVDHRHIIGDMERAYRLLVFEWLAYMRHLRKDYPYLFSLAARTNPFDPNATAEVK